jgi:hypothetical protein
MPEKQLKNVFLSVGSRYNPSQEAFLQTILALLTQFGITPRMMNYGADYPTGNFLSDIDIVMRECHGAIIIAFERKYITEGKEYPGSAKEKVLKDIRITTQWNQVEAAMAYTLRIPIFVFCENGLLKEALLEPKYHWYVEDLDIRSENLSGDVRSRLEAWCKKLSVTAPGLYRPIGDTRTVGEILKMLTLKTAAQILIIVSMVFGGGVAAGKWLQQLSPPSAATTQH